MFEKLEEEIEVKADEYALEESTACNYGESSKHVYKGYFYGFKKGAEFGYNKANEWHYVKEELPELYKDVLVVFSQGDCGVKYLTKHNEWVGRGSWCSLADVIAWKEIVLPKEIKENDI